MKQNSNNAIYGKSHFYPNITGSNQRNCMETDEDLQALKAVLIQFLNDRLQRELDLYGIMEPLMMEK